MTELNRPPTAEEVRLRLEAETGSLPTSGTLGALLAFSPGAWVHAVFLSLKIPIPRRTKSSPKVDYRREVFVYLSDPTRLGQVVAGLTPDARKLLQLLVAAPGFVAYREVTDRFGRDDADGYFWLSHPPSGPLALLRRAGLAYVGRHAGDLKVAVPAELKRLPRL